ncbi:hypothetical protein [Bacillus sp. es.034]|uniref:DUF6946 family protein n=1 Tax=Bacillus sp. es.034 TaxID=1761763 RepID=UPI000C002C96|nr:hypothetical protein [Bacillus sp. es.034]PFG07783.1 hypothetical protein ATG71_4692 [Bacillus sp. es.034]
MGKYFVPTKGMDSWKEFLTDPEKQWKPSYSAYELAKSWEGANNLPSSVQRAFEYSEIPLFKNVRVLYGFPEYKVSLPGGGAPSQNDLYLLTNAGGEILPIMVEGKVSEPFGEEVRVWKGENPSKGKINRLRSILELLGLSEEEVLYKRYQLFHRIASAEIEAKNVHAKHALMLVHSFSQHAKWFEEYQEFVNLFGVKAKKDAVVGPVNVNGVQLYFGWVTEQIPVKSKEYYYSLFKTEKAVALAKEVDHYLYAKSPYKEEVEDYHERTNNGVRTDCIGYVSIRSRYKFATITSARKACFVLHLGKRRHTETAMNMQKEIDELLGHVYEESDKGRLTPGEVYIRLEWVDRLEQITRFIDEAYNLRLQK